MFCGKGGRGRLMIWLAALISVPVNLYSLYLTALIPVSASGPSFGVVLIALVISIYLIWVLRKTAPAKESLQVRALRLVRPKNLAVMAVGVGVVLAMVIGNQYKLKQEELDRKNWRPSEQLAGLKLGMWHGDVRDLKGEPYACWDGWCQWSFTSSKRPDLVVKYDGEFVSEIGVINLRANLDGLGCSCRGGQVCDSRSCRSGSPRTSTRDNVPFQNVAEMHEILGEEDILAIDWPDKKYTYQDWEATFVFSDDLLVQVSIAEGWGRYSQGGYFVKGQQVCPGESCPWDDDGDLKPEYEKGSPRDLLDPSPELEKRLAARQAIRDKYQAAEEECEAAKVNLLGKWASEDHPDYHAEYTEQGKMHYSDGRDWRSEGKWHYFCWNSPDEDMVVKLEEDVQTCSKCARTQRRHDVSILDANTFILTFKAHNETVKRARVIEAKEDT